MDTKIIDFGFLNLAGEFVEKFPRIKIEFDFENSIVRIQGRPFKVESCSGYTVKFFKKKIKAIGGIEEFYKFVEKENTSKECLNCRMYRYFKTAIDL